MRDHAGTHRRQLGLESLEDRRLLSAGVSIAPVAGAPHSIAIGGRPSTSLPISSLAGEGSEKGDSDDRPGPQEATTGRPSDPAVFAPPLVAGSSVGMGVLAGFKPPGPSSDQVDMVFSILAVGAVGDFPGAAHEFSLGMGMPTVGDANSTGLLVIGRSGPRELDPETPDWALIPSTKSEPPMESRPALESSETAGWAGFFALSGEGLAPGSPRFERAALESAFDHWFEQMGSLDPFVAAGETTATPILPLSIAVSVVAAGVVAARRSRRGAGVGLNPFGPRIAGGRSLFPDLPGGWSPRFP